MIPKLTKVSALGNGLVGMSELRLAGTMGTNISRDSMRQKADLHSFAVAGPHRERWLTSHSAPEGSRKRSKGIARPAVLDPRVK